MLFCGDKNPPPSSVTDSKPYTVKDNEKKSYKNKFSPWDGHYIPLTKYIQKSMNDPDSYEHVSTTYFENKNSVVITTQFRGKNAFGGKVVNKVIAICDMSGDIINVSFDE